MKVDNPKSYGDSNKVSCDHCPFTDGSGAVLPAYYYGKPGWKVKRDHFSCIGGCPTLETYAEACELAEKEAQK